MLENTRKSILGYQFLIAEDFSSKEEVISKVKYRISNLELLDDDYEAVESVKLLKKFLKDCGLHQKKIDRLENKEDFYYSALMNMQNKEQKNYIIHKLNELDNEKIKFL